jgi:hypothetical protein
VSKTKEGQIGPDNTAKLTDRTREMRGPDLRGSEEVARTGTRRREEIEETREMDREEEKGRGRGRGRGTEREREKVVGLEKINAFPDKPAAYSYTYDSQHSLAHGHTSAYRLPVCSSRLFSNPFEFHPDPFRAQSQARPRPVDDLYYYV